MKLLDVYMQETDANCRLVGIVEKEDHQKIELFFEYPAQFRSFINVSADPFFPVLLIPSMHQGEDLEIVPEISEKLLANSETIQDIFVNWYPGVFRKIHIRSISRKVRIKTSEASGQFFSLGVDSFYTLLKNRGDSLKYLIYMQGLELPLSRYRHNQERGVLDNLLNVSSHYNMELICGKTNFRDHFDLDWPKYYHGAGLASAAISLGKGLGRMYVASSHSYGAQIPVGSSFMLDHLWSTGQIDIVHDGAERGRGFKVADLVADDPFALNNLRVCTENDGGDFNCCRCRKCISTMAVLEIIGKLEESDAFPLKKVKGEIYKIQPYSLSSYALTKDLHSLALKYNRFDLAREVENELIIGQHDLYGRKELSTGMIKYIGEFVFYLCLKLRRAISGEHNAAIGIFLQALVSVYKSKNKNSS